MNRTRGAAFIMGGAHLPYQRITPCLLSQGRCAGRRNSPPSMAPPCPSASPPACRLSPIISALTTNGNRSTTHKQDHSRHAQSESAAMSPPSPSPPRAFVVARSRSAPCPSPQRRSYQCGCPLRRPATASGSRSAPAELRSVRPSRVPYDRSLRPCPCS